ncbi:MAG: hypothetical protein RIQ50_302, partial [Bacteroidota bacterium]
FKISDEIRQSQTEKLNQLRSNRNAEAVDRCLSLLTTAAKEGTNLMPFVVDAVENKCTLGEISHALRKVFGEHRQ